MAARRKAKMAETFSSTAVLIARVSSKGQEEEGFSLEAQVKILTNYCGITDLHIGRVYKILTCASSEKPSSSCPFEETRAISTAVELNVSAILAFLLAAMF